MTYSPISFDALGEGVTSVKLGDRVIAMTGHGSMAEYVVAGENRVVPMSDAMPFDVAAGFTMTYGTSHHALKQRAQLPWHCKPLATDEEP